MKARLLEDHPWLKAPPAKMSGKSPGERQLISLCYHKHDLTGILERLSSKTLDRLENLGHLDTIKKLCGEWTIYARYSPRMADIGEASNFLNRIREVKKCLG
ncbi:MAG: hypothetical protein JXQ73_19220 [Phycisphaerae bacterium]|nr:hypothetical protein [Phycisphaerae bacterium]